MYPVNTMTALPLLQLTCALDGTEAGRLDLGDAWRRFLEFCALPASNLEDHISFQAETTRDVDMPVLTLRLSRQLTDAAWVGPTGPDPTDPSPLANTRSIYIEFLFDGVPSDLDGITLWAEDFPELVSGTLPVS